MASRVPEVSYSTGAAYERDGKWYVMVVIDNASQVERPATEDEIPAKAKAPEPLLKKKAK